MGKEAKTVSFISLLLYLICYENKRIVAKKWKRIFEAEQAKRMRHGSLFASIRFERKKYTV